MAWGHGRSYYGLYVLTDLSPMLRSRSCGESWVVRIDKRENWFLNSTKTSPQELAGLMRQQLGQNTNCAVYLDADPSVNYELAVHAIELIQSTKAKAVVLLTPKTSFRLGSCWLSC
jgi:biopolymer transport protein ExbD